MIRTYVVLDLSPDCGDEFEEFEEFDESAEIMPCSEDFRERGDIYHQAATIAAKLEKDGWRFESFRTFARAEHPDVHTPAQTRERLATLGITNEVEIEPVDYELLWENILRRRNLQLAQTDEK